MKSRRFSTVREIIQMEEYKILTYPEDWPLQEGDQVGWGNWTEPHRELGHPNWVTLLRCELNSYNPVDKPSYIYRRLIDKKEDAMTLEEARIYKKALQQIVCSHITPDGRTAISGGNDYLMCWACGLEWNYGKRQRPGPIEITKLALEKGMLWNCNI